MDIKRVTLNFQHHIRSQNKFGLSEAYETNDILIHLERVATESRTLGFDFTPTVKTGVKNIMLDAHEQYKFGPISEQAKAGTKDIILFTDILLAVVDNGNSLAIFVEFSLSPDMDRDTIIKDSKKTYGRVVTRLGSVRRLPNYSRTVSAFSQNF